jgi:hypothetical protein
MLVRRAAGAPRLPAASRWPCCLAQPDLRGAARLPSQGAHHVTLHPCRIEFSRGTAPGQKAWEQALRRP